MDIIVGMDKGQFDDQFNDRRTFNEKENNMFGFHFQIVKKLVKGLVFHKSKMYFCSDNKIVGCAIIADVSLLDDTAQALWMGRFWKFKGSYLISYARAYWYRESVEYKGKIKLLYAKKFNDKNLMKKLSGLEIIQQEKEVLTRMREED